MPSFLRNRGRPSERWGSSLGFVLAASGSAVGLGNLWGFAYRASQGGGAAFVLLYLLIVLHGVQGVAIAHWFVNARSMARGWLAAMYLALVFVPRFIVPLAVTGLSDSWMDWRGRAARAGTGQS